MAPQINGETAHERAARNWQKKQQKAGKCPTCGEPSGGYRLCEKHRNMDRLRKNKPKRRKKTARR